MQVELEAKLLITSGQQPNLTGLELKKFHRQLKITNDYRNECKDIKLILNQIYLDHKSRCRRSNIDGNTAYVSTISPSTASQSVASSDYSSSDTSSSTNPPEELIANKSDTIMDTFAALEIYLTCTTLPVVEDDSKIQPNEIDCVSTTINDTMEDDNKPPPTSAVVLM